MKNQTHRAGTTARVLAVCITVVFVSCGAEATRTVAPPTRAKARTATETDAGPPPARTFASFTRGKDFAFTPAQSKPKLRPLPPGTGYSRFAPDGQTLLLSGRTSLLMSPSHPQGVLLPDTRAYRSGFSPDSKYLVTTEEDGLVVVWSVPDGKVVVRVEDAFRLSRKHAAGEVVFGSPTRVLLHDGCQLKKLDIGESSFSLVTRMEACAYPMPAHNGKGFVLGREGERSWGEGRWYDRVSFLEAGSGEARVLLEETPERAFTDLFFAPNGERLCFRGKDKRLSCIHTRGEDFVTFTTAYASRWASFDTKGLRVLFAEGDTYDETLTHIDLLLADYETRQVRRIASVPKRMRRWHFGTNERLVVVQGYVGAIAFDLVGNVSHVVMTEESESEVFARIPGAELRMILGRARGAGTDLFEVTLPDS